MGTVQMLPVWIANGTSMAASFNTDPVQLPFEDDIGIQGVWTGTPTGTIDIQVSMDIDNLGWQTIPFSPPATQPAGAAGTIWFEIYLSTAKYVRLIYTRVSGTGALYAKLSLKSV